MRSVIAADLQLHGDGPGPAVVVTPVGQGLGSREVAPGPSGHQTNPDAAYDAAGRLYVAFTDTREGLARVYLATSDDDGRTFSSARPVSGGADDGAFLSRFRPSVATVRDEPRVVFQDLGPAKSALGAVRLLAGSTQEQRPTPERLDDTGSAANQLTRPRVVSRQDGGAGVVLFEDDRAGYSRVRISDPL